MTSGWLARDGSLPAKERQDKTSTWAGGGGWIVAWGQKQGRSLLHAWWHAEEAAEGHSLPLPCPLAIPLGISPSGPLASLLFFFVCLFLKNIYLTGQGLGYTRQDLSVVACRDLLLLFFFF